MTTETKTEPQPALKPIDERWMVRALLYLDKAERKGERPTWAEICAHMGWRQSCNTWHKMEKLRRRGVAYVDNEPRSTHLTPEGVVHLNAALKAGQSRTHSGRR